MSFDGVFLQVLQPAFFFSVVFLVLSFVCVKVFIRFCPFISERVKSGLYVVPLIVPLLVMAVFFPSFTFQQSVVDVRSVPPLVLADHVAPLVSGGFLVSGHQVSTLSVTGILCIVGLVMGVLFAVSMLIADDRIASRILRVIPLCSDEQPWLQAMVSESSKKMGIACPKIGVVEDLRSNAFTIGYGRGATIVFSIGILELLDKDELTAVALHELAHVKHNDFFFKIFTSALTAMSFFNPLAFITVSEVQRRRELFADEGAIALLDTPKVLSSALTKICASIKTLPATGVFAKASTGLFVTSSVLYRSGIFATHPRLDKRLRNIFAPQKSNTRLSRKAVAQVLLLSLVLISLFVLSSYAVVELQHLCYANSDQDHLVELAGYRVHKGAVGEKLFGEKLSEGLIYTSHGVFNPVDVQMDNTFVIHQGGNHILKTLGHPPF
ncbi:MAG: M48 family metalloprotease [Nitrososphaerota archaeon]|jgi:heat shock protein HtpX|nr:M48 family metalloprotease [Nitrososphaerota archaeon]